MSGAADGRLQGRSVERPSSDADWPGWATAVDHPVDHLVDHPVDDRGRVPTARRPVALLVAGDVDPWQIVRRLDAYFHVIITTNLPAAITVLGDLRLDIVLIDAALPDPAMMELITQVRVRQWLRGLPIICYGSAALGGPTSRLAGLAAHDVIAEPMSTDELVSRISAVLTWN